MLNQLLAKAHQLKISDLYISVGLPPTAKINGQLQSLSADPLNSEEVYDLLKRSDGRVSFCPF